LLFSLLFDLESCRKADDVLPTTPVAEEEQNLAVNLKDAKQWLNNKVVAENGRVDVPGGIWAEPIWSGNSAYEFKDGFQILRVDMAGDGLGNYGYREMIFFKDSVGQVDAVIMEVLGFVDYMQRKEKEKGPGLPIKEYIDSDDFSGDIYIYDLGHNFLKGRRYKRNELVNEFIPVTASASNGRFPPPVPPCEDCGLNSGGSGGGWGTPVNLPAFEVTAPALNNSFPSWSTGVSYRPLVPSQLPSWNHNNSGYDMPIGGGGGGHKNNNATSIRIVKNEIKNPCIKEVFNNISDQQLLNNIRYLFLNDLKEDKNLTFIFSDGWSGGDNYTPAQTIPIITGTTITGYKINLNGKVISKFSKELIAEIIHHETIHAWLNQQKGYKVGQHDNMIRTLLDDLVKADREIFPNYSIKDAYANALFGFSEMLRFEDSKEIFKDKLKEYNLTLEECETIYRKYSLGDSSGKKLGTRCK